MIRIPAALCCGLSLREAASRSFSYATPRFPDNNLKKLSFYNIFESVMSEFHSETPALWSRRCTTTRRWESRSRSAPAGSSSRTTASKTKACVRVPCPSAHFPMPRCFVLLLPLVLRRCCTRSTAWRKSRPLRCVRLEHTSYENRHRSDIVVNPSDIPPDLACVVISADAPCFPAKCPLIV